MKLVIVESPSKAKTIGKYLGSEYEVRSSVGHIRDLPKNNKDAIDIEHGFQPRYVIVPGKENIIRELVKEAKNAEEIYLATDPDREGEAIAWHLREVLREKLGEKLPETKRARFYEITEKAVKSAITEAEEIDLKLKRAQEARRVLDRLFGYTLSELIWKKLRYGLSAGRVQSPALRILMEREREIRAFTPKPYYILEGDFRSESGSILKLQAEREIEELEEAIQIVEKAKRAQWSIAEIQERETQRKPRAPFTTSTLQQLASTRLGFSPSRTMRAAQALYQAGHITYMRTDSTRLSDEALASIHAYIRKEYGDEYLEARKYQTKSKNAQEAHEAIRPTKFDGKTYGSTEDERALYELIRRRTVASQMANARLKKQKLVARGGGTKEAEKLPAFVTHGVQLLFPGWLIIDPDAKQEEVLLPSVREGEALELLEMRNLEKMTTPPHRYTEAGLIKELEKRGIGRPSTYASIMKTLVDRGYVTREGRTLYPTDTGDVVSTFLEEHFSPYIADNFTAKMEDELDEIARGENEYERVLSEFWEPFSRDVAAKQDIPKLTNLGPAEGYTCPKCGAPMVYKLGRGGKFISCSRYPTCDGALTLDGKDMNEERIIGAHPETGEPILLKEGRFGPYLQLGRDPHIPELPSFPKGHRKTPEEKELVKRIREERARLKEQKPRRASLPKGTKPEEVDLETALKLLSLPRELGIHPESGEMIIANIGRFGPYVGHGREFRSIKPSSGLDPYTITYEEALKILSEPKALPKGVELVKVLGMHPKTKKEIRLLKSKSGYFLQKGMRRIYLDENLDPETFTLEDAIRTLEGKTENA